jgi:transposase-like protein
VSKATDNSAAPFVARQEAKRRAIDRYQTTNLTPGAIATELGVSRETVYRWLRTDRVSRGPGAANAAHAVDDRLTGISAELGDLRRALMILIGQVGRVEEAVARLEHHPG